MRWFCADTQRNRYAGSDALWQVSIAGPNRSYVLTTPRVLLATGKHDLRGLPRPVGVQADFVGLKMYLRLTATQVSAIDNTIELILLPRGYGGLSLVEGGIANLCFVLDRNLLRNTMRDWPGLAEFLMRIPHVRARLAGAEPLLGRPLAISPIPYGFLRRDAIAENLFAIGDQAAVIPSFTGDGLAIALHSGRLAARAVLSGRSAQMFQADLHAQLRPQIDVATKLSRALVRQPQRMAAELATSLFPGLLRTIAARTRLAPEHRLGPQSFSAHEKTCALA